MLRRLLTALSRKREVSPPASAAGADVETETEAGAVVLVVDDDPEHRTLVRLVLEAKRYRVITATNGREAVATATKERPDAIVMDGSMPEMDGFEALRRLRRARGTADIPVVMLTMRVREGDVLTGFRNGAQEYLTKPVVMAELVNRLESLLARSR